MLADHLFEILDRFELDIVFGVPEIHECTSVNTMLGNDDLDTTVWIDRWRRCLVTTDYNERGKPDD